MSFSKYLDFFHNDNLETVQNWFNDNIHLFLQAEADEISYEKVYLRENHDIFMSCCILHNLINMFNDSIADPIYELDPDVDEQTFLDWDTDIHPNWEDYIKSLPSNINPGSLSVIIKKPINSDLYQFPTLESNDIEQALLDIDFNVSTEPVKKLSKRRLQLALVIKPLSTSSIPPLRSSLIPSNDSSVLFPNSDPFKINTSIEPLLSSNEDEDEPPIPQVGYIL